MPKAPNIRKVYVSTETDYVVFRRTVRGSLGSR